MVMPSPGTLHPVKISQPTNCPLNQLRHCIIIYASVRICHVLLKGVNSVSNIPYSSLPIFKSPASPASSSLDYHEDDAASKSGIDTTSRRRRRHVTEPPLPPLLPCVRMTTMMQHIVSLRRNALHLIMSPTSPPQDLQRRQCDVACHLRRLRDGRRPSLSYHHHYHHRNHNFRHAFGPPRIDDQGDATTRRDGEEGRCMTTRGEYDIPGKLDNEERHEDERGERDDEREHEGLVLQPLIVVIVAFPWSPLPLVPLLLLPPASQRRHVIPSSLLHEDGGWLEQVDARRGEKKESPNDDYDDEQRPKRSPATRIHSRTRPQRGGGRGG
ncbi:hypothetical protein BDQ17DRAFT_1543617, partial [Cyathus striatus]